MPKQTICGISISGQRSGPEPLEWECWLQVQTTRELLTLGSIKQWGLPQRKPLEYKTLHHSTASNTLCQPPHPNNQQDKNMNPIIGIEDYHLTQPCPSQEEKKLSTLTLHEAYTNNCTNLRRAETKRKKGFNPEAWEKETSNTVS